MRWLLGLGLLAAAGGAAVVLAGPYWTLYEIREGLRTGNARQISRQIDMPAVRAQLGTEIRAILAHEATTTFAEGSGGEAIGAGLALAFAPAIIDPMLDGWISEGGVRRLLGDEALVEPLAQKSMRLEALPRMHWTALDEAELELTIRPEAPKLGVILRRDGIRWRVAGLDLAGLDLAEILLNEIEAARRKQAGRARKAERERWASERRARKAELQPYLDDPNKARAAILGAGWLCDNTHGITTYQPADRFLSYAVNVHCIGDNHRYRIHSNGAVEEASPRSGRRQG